MVIIELCCIDDAHGSKCELLIYWVSYSLLCIIHAGLKIRISGHMLLL